ncbi:hypothetical protein [Thermoanaerobacterium thermosaccharolyticum]|uniref:hypothetical protein n=1 Tax=Thermoanaerobacterium thermosaccharolyticum TaxID=1517 RepID=UPI001238775F|nr:hypothetical protein [Thermoanaerobacterium thermosaccharolyticum]KAA5806505.1 hypothetical protein F1655_08515 [Thermoanaerobacterium thermosaccharolyticum]
MNANYAVYERAYTNTIREYQEGISQDIKLIAIKVIFYGVKMVNSMKDEILEEDLIYHFKLMVIIIDLMATLTPKEFMIIFPIKKDYDGKKYGFKDYFYTMDYIKMLDVDSLIGDKIFDFLWEYTNDDITEFMVKLMLTISHLRKAEGETTIAEEFANMVGIKTYKVYTDDKGKKFLYDGETGKTMPIKEQKPFKIIKNDNVKVR